MKRPRRSARGTRNFSCLPVRIFGFTLRRTDLSLVINSTVDMKLNVSTHRTQRKQLSMNGSDRLSRGALIDGFNDGASLVNYIGHGGGGIWSSSRMLDFEDPEQNLTNISQLPLVISMTCYTGSFDSNKNSLVEELLRSENGGAIAVIGATSIGLLDGDYLLNLEIFNVIFKQRTQHIGAVLAEAKTQFLINAPGYLDLAEVFTLFGDPATRLKLPNKTDAS